MSRKSCICQNKFEGVLVAAGILLISALHLFSGRRLVELLVSLYTYDLALQACCN